MPKILKTEQWPQDWKRSVFIPIPKKGIAKECSNYWTIALISHASKSVSSVAQSCPTLCNPMYHSTPGLPVHLPTPGVHPNPCPLSQWCHPTISSCRPLLLPSIFPSNRVFSNEAALPIRWPKYWSFSFNMSPSNEHPGLIFRMDWLHLLEVQGTLKSLLQHHSSKASLLWRSAFFTVKFSHP